MPISANAISILYPRLVVISSSSDSNYDCIPVARGRPLGATRREELCGPFIGHGRYRLRWWYQLVWDGTCSESNAPLTKSPTLVNNRTRNLSVVSIRVSDNISMARKPKTIPGPSRLSKILANLNASPRLELSNLQSIKLTLASKNDHFGARYVVAFVHFQSPPAHHALH